MSGPWWTLSAAVGTVVLAVMFASCVWFLAAICIEAVRDLADERRRTVPRRWVIEEARRRDRAACTHHSKESADGSTTSPVRNERNRTR